MDNILKQYSICLNNNLYLLNKDTLDLEYIKNSIDSNTSIIFFDNNFSFENPVFNDFNTNVFDKLIIIGNIEKKVRKKRLFVNKSIFKKTLQHVKKRLFIIVSLPNEFEELKKLVKNLIKLRQICLDLNISWINSINGNNIAGYIVAQDSKYIQDIINIFYILLLNDRKQQYEYIYDITCNYLDNQFINNNFCDFKNDKCIANRNLSTAHCDMGCCYSFEYSKFWETSFTKNVKLCEHLQNTTCSTACIACKMFTCKDLRKNNICFKIKDFLLLDCFFNKKQHLILKYNFFKTREEIINKLLEPNKLPYLLYYLNNNYIIK